MQVQGAYIHVEETDSIKVKPSAVYPGCHIVEIGPALELRMGEDELIGLRDSLSAYIRQARRQANRERSNR